MKVVVIDEIQWVAVGVSGQETQVLAVLMHDEHPARLHFFDLDAWNELPHHWFVDRGVAPKTGVRFKIPDE